MRILPVLDLKGGQVVRGVAGRRKEYRPIVSRIVSSAEPLAVARAFREQFGLRELYVADLDAIAGGPPDQATLVDLLDDGFQLWVDAGVGPSGNTLKALAVMGVGARSPAWSRCKDRKSCSSCSSGCRVGASCFLWT